MTDPTSAVIYLGPDDEGPQETSSSTLTAHVSQRGNLSSSLKSVPSASLSTITLIIPTTALSTIFDPLAIASLAESLRPGSSIDLKIVPSLDGVGTPNLAAVNTSFLLAGLDATSERREKDGTRVISGRKKDRLSVVAPVSIRIGKPAASEEKSADAPIRINTRVTLIGLDDDSDDDDLVDEDGLLGFDDDFLAPPAVSENRIEDDCGGRKACDDCTCGRAEEEAGAAPKQAPSSACGSCGKGDAFRCAGCPYLGKPAFKAGEEHLVLDLTDDI